MPGNYSTLIDKVEHFLGSRSDLDREIGRVTDCHADRGDAGHGREAAGCGLGGDHCRWQGRPGRCWLLMEDALAGLADLAYRLTMLDQLGGEGGASCAG